MAAIRWEKMMARLAQHRFFASTILVRWVLFSPPSDSILETSPFILVSFVINSTHDNFNRSHRFALDATMVRFLWFRVNEISAASPWRRPWKSMKALYPIWRQTMTVVGELDVQCQFLGHRERLIIGVRWSALTLMDSFVFGPHYLGRNLVWNASTSSVVVKKVFKIAMEVHVVFAHVWGARG